MDGGTNAAHLAAWHMGKQTSGLVRRGPVGDPQMCHLSLRGKAEQSRLPGCACNGFWTLCPNGYSGLVKKQIRTTHEAPSARGRLSGTAGYAACFLGAARRALARWMRFSLAARPRRTCGFIAGTTRRELITCSAGDARINSRPDGTWNSVAVQLN